MRHLNNKNAHKQPAHNSDWALVVSVALFLKPTGIIPLYGQALPKDNSS